MKFENAQNVMFQRDMSVKNLSNKNSQLIDCTPFTKQMENSNIYHYQSNANSSNLNALPNEVNSFMLGAPSNQSEFSYNTKYYKPNCVINFTSKKNCNSNANKAKEEEI